MSRRLRCKVYVRVASSKIRKFIRVRKKSEFGLFPSIIRKEQSS